MVSGAVVMPCRRAHGRIIAGIALTYVLDALSKQVVLQTLAVGQSLPIWPGVFHVTRTENTGAAFSLFYQYPMALTLISAGLLVLFIAVLWRKSRFERLETLGFSLVIGGALGNLTDRLHHGAVIDFLDFTLIRYPVFNLADTAICVGMLCLVWDYVRRHAHSAPGS